ncbi:MAG: DUF4394 domain-containing protein [Labilithrix sp.]|nr:DUF4394 domain-containing protein [Labilithrix sp.]
MSKNVLAVALASSFVVGFVVGCSDDGDAPAAPEAPPVVIGPADPPPGADQDASLPELNLPVEPPAPAAVDAGPDVQPSEVDPGPTLGARIWGVDEDGRLVNFRVNAAGTVSVKLITGLATNEKLLGVDFRPANGLMYGLGSSSRIYTIDRTTGEATVVGDGAAFTPAVAGQAHGFDFNPVADRIRLHTDVDQDLRIDPNTGKVAGVDAPLAFATGDVNEGQSPNVVGTAYTNSVNPAPATTVLYAIDSTRDLLVRLNNPNDGMIQTLGSLGIDVDQAAGFDITGAGVAYAVLKVGPETALYTIDLTTAAATKVGVLGYPVGLTGIAVEP